MLQNPTPPSLEDWLAEPNQSWMQTPEISSPQREELIEVVYMFSHLLRCATEYYILNPTERLRKYSLDDIDEKFCEAIQELKDFNRQLVLVSKQPQIEEAKPVDVIPIASKRRR